MFYKGDRRYGQPKVEAYFQVPASSFDLVLGLICSRLHSDILNGLRFAVTAVAKMLSHCVCSLVLRNLLADRADPTRWSSPRVPLELALPRVRMRLSGSICCQSRYSLRHRLFALLSLLQPPLLLCFDMRAFVLWRFVCRGTLTAPSLPHVPSSLPRSPLPSSPHPRPPCFARVTSPAPRPRQDALSDVAYPAAVAGLGYSLDFTTRGPQLHFWGLSPKLAEFAAGVARAVADHAPDDEAAFLRHKDVVSRDLRAFDSAQVPPASWHLASCLLSPLISHHLFSLIASYHGLRLGPGAGPLPRILASAPPLLSRQLACR